METLHMGYTSYSENRISKQLVAEYIIYIIMKYREPRFLEVSCHIISVFIFWTLTSIYMI